MKPPKCPYCSVSEWRHVCGGAINKSVVNKETAVVNAVVNKRKNPDRHKDKEARRAYLREYMKKRRAK